MNINLDDLSRFCFSMAKCLSSGMPLRKSLELSGGNSPSKALRQSVQVAVASVDAGKTVSEALQSSAHHFPHFFIPIIQAGELGGRQVEAFQLLDEHCKRLKPSLALVRKTWLYPLILVLCGYTIRTGIFLYFGMYQLAWWFVVDTFGTLALFILIGWALYKIRLVKEAVDWILLQLPVIRETEIRLATVLFFSTFRLVYAAGGLGVLTMVDLALQTVRNSAIRKDLAAVRPILEEHGTFEEAFSQPSILEPPIKGLMATGALSGHLEASLDQVVSMTAQQLEFTLNLFNQVFFRLFAFGVAMSIIGTLMMCISYAPAR